MTEEEKGRFRQLKAEVSEQLRQGAVHTPTVTAVRLSKQISVSAIMCLE